MTIQNLAALAALAGFNLSASEAAGSIDSKVTVCIEGVYPVLLWRPKNLVSEMFAAIDVGIDWRWRNCPADAIHITLQLLTSPSQEPGALAYAMPYEGTHIVIFYDRVQKTVGPSRVPALMAHVIAHEIAHILEGVSRHSKTGLMKAHWSDKDYLDMAWKPLPFAPEDVILIHHGLEQRSKRNNRCGSISRTSQ
jgi:hypothetical protein